MTNPSAELLATPCQKCGEVDRDAYGNCKRCSTDRTATWRNAHPEQKAQHARRSLLKTQYNITEAAYDALFRRQNGVCAICGKPETRIQRGTVMQLSVDHDHACCPGKRSCGKCVRGLLCNACNHGISKLRDDPVLLAAAIIYLRPRHVLLSGIVQLLLGWLRRLE
jgi:Recombination endonuclease VII